MAVTPSSTELASQLAAKAALIPSLRAVRLQADYVPARLPSGKVTGIWGEALIRTPDGDLRELVVGDEIRKGDVIMTTQNGIVQLDEEGSRLARVPDALEQILTDLPPPGAGLPGVDPGSLQPGLRVDRVNEGTTGSAFAFATADREGPAAFVAALGDAALPSVLISSPTVNESSGTAVFTLTLTAPNTQGVTVGLSTQNGTATGGGVDYGSTTPSNIEVSTDGGTTWTPATSVTLPAGTTTALVRVPIVGDTIDEPNESFTLTATAPDAGGGTTAVVGTVTIVDDDPTPQVISVTPRGADLNGNAIVDVIEGTGTANALTFDITLSNASSRPLTYTLALTGNGSNPVVPSTDLGALSVSGNVTLGANGTTVTVPAGQTTFTVTLLTNPDRLDEVAEGLALTVGGVAGLAEVIDDDSAPTATSSTVAAVEEGGLVAVVPTLPQDADGDALTITVTSLPTIGRLGLIGGNPAVLATQIQVGQALTMADLAALRFEPPADYNGTAPVGRFEYTVSDGVNSTAAATTINLTPVNDAPVVNGVTLTALSELNPALAVPETRTITQADLLRASSDIDGDTLQVTNLSIVNPGKGTLIQVDATTWKYTPALFDDTSVSFKFDVSDNSTLSPGPKTGTATATLDLLPFDNPPTNVLPTAPSGLTTDEDTPLVFSAATGNAIVVEDVDTPIVTTTIGLSLPAGAPVGAAAGTLTLANPAPAGVTVTLLAAGGIALTGSSAAITAALEGLTFRNAPDFYTRGTNGVDIDVPGITLTVETTDSVNTPPTTSTTELVVDAVIDIQIRGDFTSEGVATGPFSLADLRGNSATLGFENAGAQIVAINGQSIVPGGVVIAEGGKVTMNANHDIVYTPDALFTTPTADPAKFTYTVSSGGREEVAAYFVQVNPGATRTGTAGVSDVFAWHLGDAGTTASPRNYTVVAFDTAAPAAKGDVLDLRDLLQGETTGTIDSYLDFAKVGADTRVSIHSTGAAGVDQTILLKNVDLVSSFGNDAAIISNLIAQQKLLVDPV